MDLRPAKSGAASNKRAPDLDAIMEMMAGTSTLEAVQYFRQQFSKVMKQLGMSDQIVALDPKFQEFEDSIAHITNLRSHRQLSTWTGEVPEFTRIRGAVIKPLQPEAVPEPESGVGPSA